MRRHLLCVFLISLLSYSAAYAQNERDRAVRDDRDKLVDDSVWLYDRLDLAISRAADTQRPLMIVFR